MGLFEPKVLRNLRAELVAANAACAASRTLPLDHQARIALTAPREIAAAAKAAAAAGQSPAARKLLMEKLESPPTACPVGTTWDEIIQAGIATLA